MKTGLPDGGLKENLGKGSADQLATATKVLHFNPI